MRPEAYEPNVVRMPDWFHKLMLSCSVLLCVTSSVFVGVRSQTSGANYGEIAIPCIISVFFTFKHFRHAPPHWSRWFLATLCIGGALSYSDLLFQAFSK